MRQLSIFEKEPRTYWTEKEIRKTLNDAKWALRGACQLYLKQTESERLAGRSLIENGVGFNGPDSQVLSPIVKSYLQTHKITMHDIEIVKSKMWRYSKQLTKIANELLKEKNGSK